MDVYLISEDGVEAHSAGELSGLLDKPDALIWVDIGLCIGQDTAVLSEVFGFHEIAVRDCVQRNHVSKIHVYDDHVFTVLHAPEVGVAGHVHYVELDQFLGRNYLVTVHGPLNPAVNPEVAFLDTRAVLQRLESGHLEVHSPFELSSAIIASLTRREIELIAGLAKESGRLEQRVTLGRGRPTTPSSSSKNCSRSGTSCSRSAPSRCTAPQPTTGWPSWPGPCRRTRSRWSPTSPTASSR